MSWRVARSLEVLLAEVNRAAPNRSTDSDGSIGDPAHSSRESDHNPNNLGVVRARDFTHDPSHGFDAGKLAEGVRRLGLAGHPALGPGAYVIWNRRIASATADGARWDWEPYAGTNPHTAHVHVSVTTHPGDRGYDSLRPWTIEERPDMNHAQDARLKRIERQVETTHTVVTAQLERANRRLARANTRLARLRQLGLTSRAEVEAALDDIQAILEENAPETEDTPTP